MLSGTLSSGLSLYVNLYDFGLVRIICDASLVYTSTKFNGYEIIILLFLRQVNWTKVRFVTVSVTVCVGRDVEQVLQSGRTILIVLDKISYIVLCFVRGIYASETVL